VKAILYRWYVVVYFITTLAIQAWYHWHRWRARHRRPVEPWPL
jgi:hypothetical protein